MRTPNKEQKLAIEKNGGVLLSAGAGSGKTFVIVEHFCHKLKDSCSKVDEASLEQKVKEVLSQMAIMTFTKKAAGEVKIRLIQRVKEEIGLNKEKYWEYIHENINLLFLGTIHSFCYSLIKKGIFKSLSSNIEIIEDFKMKKVISDLIDKWFQINVNSISEEDYNLLFANNAKIKKMIQEAFSSPEIRKLWDGEINIEPSDLFNDWINAENISFLYQTEIDLNRYDSKAKWHKVISSFNQIKKMNPLESLENFDLYINFYKEYKTITAPRGEDLYEIKHYLNGVRKLRDLLVKNKESFYSYFRYGKTFKEIWIKRIGDIYNFISDNYLLNGGITFSDLEYYVERELNNPEVANRASEKFNYIIVDEFQDTSMIQYNIIDRIIQKNLTKLFLVGDPKQAIYGFRGGEVGVFNSISTTMDSNLSLTANYRSESQLINFCNYFFSKSLNLGDNFEGEDNFKVPFMAQDASSSTSEGKVEIWNSDDFLDKSLKLSPKEIDILESRAILKMIEEYRKESSELEICVLYKK